MRIDRGALYRCVLAAIALVSASLAVLTAAARHDHRAVTVMRVQPLQLLAQSKPLIDSSAVRP